ncbi:hypothetical protein GmHk_16G045557 [Glycine max]|nr:hypothetical protein GmHk_16G045557 [Glycine max]
MADWGPVFVSVVLFILLTPGLLIQIPGKGKMVEFGNFQTSGVSILVHSILYFALVCIFLMAIGVHIDQILDLMQNIPVIPSVVLKYFSVSSLPNYPTRNIKKNSRVAINIVTDPR